MQTDLREGGNKRLDFSSSAQPVLPRVGGRWQEGFVALLWRERYPEEIAVATSDQ